MQKIKSYKWWTIFSLCFIALMELFYFRNLIGNANMMGDFGDGRFCTLAVEHWYKVLCGKESILDLGMFYPATNSIAYSDVFMGFAPVYILFRLIGFDMFAANKMMLIVLHAFGSYTMYYLLKKKWSLSSLSSLLGVIIFNYTGSLNAANHTQMFAVQFIPFLIIMIWGFFETINEDKKKRIIYAILSISMLALIFYSAGYVGYFVLVFAAVMLATWYVLSAVYKREYWGKTWQFVKKHVPECILYVVYGVAIMFPFLKIYLPINSMYGKRAFDEVLLYMPKMRDFFNIDRTNLLEGNLITALGFDDHSSEIMLGFPIVTGIVVIVATAYLFGKKQDEKNKVAYVATVSGVSMLLCFILIAKVGDFSLWKIVYKYIPGIGSMRAVGRFMQILAIPAAGVVAVFFEYLWKKYEKTSKYVTMVLGGVFIDSALEHVWKGGIPSYWSAETYRQMLKDVPELPEDCKAIFVIEPEGVIDSRAYTPGQLDGWLIASYMDTRTINGYSSYYPLGWEPINNLTDAAYIDNVRGWVEQNNLTGIYGYDMALHEWIELDDL